MVHRAEVKVYMSHTEAYTIQQAAKAAGMTVSTFMRVNALAIAITQYGIPHYVSLVERGQIELPIKKGAE